MKRALLILSIILGLSEYASHAQKVSVSTDILTWANFGTANLQASVAVAKELTLNAGMKYNPWSFHPKKGQMQNRQQTYNLGVRWWPWHIYSGWWLGGALQYQEYNRGGILSPRTKEGDAVGLSLSAGYTLMLHKNINLEFGLGTWGGMTRYTEYSCPNCGRIEGQGDKLFFLPDDVSISLMFIF